MNRITTILRDNLKLILASVAAFTVGIPAGVLTYPQLEDELPAILNEAFKGVLSGPTHEIILKVFLRNVSASLIMLMVGMTVLLTFAVLFLNGFLVGLVFRFSLDNGLNLTQIVLGIAPHGVFELPAIFTAAAAGIHIGLQALTQKGRRVKATSQAIKEASAVYLTVVIPLLLIAAVIEVVVSRNLIG